MNFWMGSGYKGIAKIVKFIFKKLDRIFEYWTIIFARLLFYYSGMSMLIHYVQKLRNSKPVLSNFGAQIDEGTLIYPGIILHGAANDFSNLKIGKNCRIGRDCFFDLTDKIEINDRASISMRNTLITHVNTAESPLGDKMLPKSAPIIIETGAITYTNVTILLGVRIGECAVASAGSVVFHNVQPWALVGGNPARFIKKLK